MKEKSKFQVNTMAIFAIIVIIISFTVGFFCGEKVYMWVITPFYNDQGKFDYGIMWSALGAIGTLSISILAIWQTSKANNISKELLNLENNKARPYIKLNMSDTFFINKQAYGFSEEVLERIDKSHIRYEGMAQLDEVYKNNVNCLWPSACVFFININNMGDSSISKVMLKRFFVLDGTIGSVKGIKMSMDSSLYSKNEKTVAISINEQVPIIENGSKIYNRISEKHAECLKVPLRDKQIEITLEYEDIFGRTFLQEYTVFFSFDLREENETEYNFLIKDITIQHHVGTSPYGPRIDEQ